MQLQNYWGEGGRAGVPPVVTSLFCACDSDLHYLISKLEHDSVLATIDWFEFNYMKLNQDKCHLLISGYKFESVCPQTLVLAKLGKAMIKNFLELYILKQCQNASRKLNALTRIYKFMSLRHR